MRPPKPAKTVKRARALRRALTKPEAMLWRLLRASPGGLSFRKQHPAGAFSLDFFCARANFAIEVDGEVHNRGVQPDRDWQRDAWLKEHRIDTLRIPAVDVIRDATAVANAIVMVANERMTAFGKAPPSSLRDATSPSQVDGEDDFP